MSDVLSQTTDWLKARLADLSSFVASAGAGISMNNGLAVDTQALINRVQDPEARAQLTASVNEWVKRQQVLVTGYRNFVSGFNNIVRQAAAFLKSVGINTGISGVGELPAVVPVLIVGGILALLSVAQLVTQFNGVQRNAMLGFQETARKMLGSAPTTSDKRALVDFTNAYADMADSIARNNPDTFTSISNILKWVVIGLAAVLVLPAVMDALGASRRRAA